MVRSRWRWRGTWRTWRRRRSCAFRRRRRRRRSTFWRSRSALGRAGQHSTVSQAEGKCESSECGNHLESMKYYEA
jgi:hypothetical protein